MLAKISRLASARARTCTDNNSLPHSARSWRMNISKSAGFVRPLLSAHAKHDPRPRRGGWHVKRRGLTRHCQNPTEQSQEVWGESRGWNEERGGREKKQNKTIEEEKKERGGEREAAMDEVSSRFRAPCRSPSLATAAAALCFLAPLRCCFKMRGGESVLLLPLSPPPSLPPLLSPPYFPYRL